MPKYMEKQADEKPHLKWAFIWDVFMLIATALIFVAIAESIPAVGKLQPLARKLMFFFAMAFLFIFDVIVLLIDYSKSHVSDKLSSYPHWVLINFVLFAFCLVVGLAYRNTPDASAAKFAAAVFVCAAGRTYFDYLLSSDFLFPKESQTREPELVSPPEQHFDT